LPTGHEGVARWGVLGDVIEWQVREIWVVPSKQGNEIQKTRNRLTRRCRRKKVGPRRDQGGPRMSKNDRKKTGYKEGQSAPWGVCGKRRLWKGETSMCWQRACGVGQGAADEVEPIHALGWQSLYPRKWGKSVGNT